MAGVLAPAETLGKEAVNSLQHELAAVDWTELDRQRAALAPQTEALPLPPLDQVSAPQLAPPSTSDEASCQEARAGGEKALRAGRVAVVMVAGGQASRLGFDGPKGAFPIGALSGASLFQGFAGQLQRLRERYRTSLPWVIQTGPSNHLETINFFQRHAYFGLPQASVSFVCQGTLPALSPDGQFLLQTPTRLFRNPDGHGGIYRALATAGLLPQWRAAGIDTVYTCQVDNPLVRIADPCFLGFHLQQQAEMSVKVVEKTNAGEKVGLVVRLDDGRHQCLEYSDLSTEIQERRSPDGGLHLRAGNIAIHAFSLDFLDQMAADPLPLHLARKQIPALGPGSLLASPQDGVKFETFIFDALPRAHRSLVQLVERREEFAPVKNRSGVDSIHSARQAMVTRDRLWCATRGIELPQEGAVELFPSTALEASDLPQEGTGLDFRVGDRLLAARPSRS